MKLKVTSPPTIEFNSEASTEGDLANQSQAQDRFKQRNNELIKSNTLYAMRLRKLEEDLVALEKRCFIKDAMISDLEKDKDDLLKLLQRTDRQNPVPLVCRNVVDEWRKYITTISNASELFQENAMVCFSRLLQHVQRVINEMSYSLELTSSDAGKSLNNNNVKSSRSLLRHKESSKFKKPELKDCSESDFKAAKLLSTFPPKTKLLKKASRFQFIDRLAAHLLN